jgi:serine phosphatase RsbU (regulator of sigma subunit)
LLEQEIDEAVADQRESLPPNHGSELISATSIFERKSTFSGDAIDCERFGNCFMFTVVDVSGHVVTAAMYAILIQ